MTSQSLGNRYDDFKYVVFVDSSITKGVKILYMFVHLMTHNYFGGELIG